jgi:hypothetical protein
MKKYHKIDISTGKVLGKYARNQPHIPGLIYTEESENDYSIWTSTGWEDSLDEYKALKITELDNIYQNWFKFKKTLSPQNIFSSYSDTVDAINDSESIAEVDTVMSDNNTYLGI